MLPEESMWILPTACFYPKLKPNKALVKISRIRVLPLLQIKSL
jgi:hypothetical protein